MTIHEKIEQRFDFLQILLNNNEHMKSAEGVLAVLTAISSIAKFWSILDDGQRDFINAARIAVKDRTEWAA